MPPDIVVAKGKSHRISCLVLLAVACLVLLAILWAVAGMRSVTELAMLVGGFAVVMALAALLSKRLMATLSVGEVGITQKGAVFTMRCEWDRFTAVRLEQAGKLGYTTESSSVRDVIDRLRSACDGLDPSLSWCVAFDVDDLPAFRLASWDVTSPSEVAATLADWIEEKLLHRLGGAEPPMGAAG